MISDILPSNYVKFSTFQQKHQEILRVNLHIEVLRTVEFLKLKLNFLLKKRMFFTLILKMAASINLGYFSRFEHKRKDSYEDCQEPIAAPTSCAAMLSDLVVAS